jgi:hypothetical protein
MKLSLAIAALRARWLNGRELLAAVEGMSGGTAAYDNASACARNAKARALREGLWWQYMELSHDESTGGSDHRLWTCSEEGIPRPHRAWQQGDAVVHLESPTGHKTIFFRQSVGRQVRTREQALAIYAQIGPRPREAEAQGRLLP